MENHRHVANVALQREPAWSPEAILEVLLAVRASIIELFASVRIDPTKGRETARALGLNQNLAWRIARISNAKDILAVVPDIPTRTLTDRICVACEKLGAPPNLVERMHAVIFDFDHMVKSSADNREYFEAMVSNLVQDDVTFRQEADRKRAFLSNLSLWGVYAQLNFKTMIYVPSPDNDQMMDIVRLGGLIDFRRSRPINWPILLMASYWDDGTPRNDPSLPRPLEQAEGQSKGSPLVFPFCSQPPPKVVQVESNAGTLFELPGGSFGSAGSLDCVFGDLILGTNSRYRIAHVDEYAGSMNDLYTPSQLVVHDVFWHRDLEVNGLPEVMILDRLSMPRGSNPKVDDSHRMPLSAKVLRISAGAAGSSLTQYPKYSDLLQYVYRRMGWSAQDFQGYRFTMTFPPIPSAVAMRFKLSDPPESD